MIVCVVVGNVVFVIISVPMLPSVLSNKDHNENKFLFIKPVQ